jgi:phenylacetate-coenzyme A ligase PaaK-like adenylate-forming protein
LTRKEALRAEPDTFVRRSARPAFRTTTSGTTGRPTGVSFSLHELQVYIALSAIGFLIDGQIGPEDVVQISASARATLGNTCFAGACARVGAQVYLAGLVAPELGLRLLTEERGLAGKKPRASVLDTYPSYLGRLVETGQKLGYGPADFGLNRILVGGEIVTAGLKARAERYFGPAAFHEGYGMTEIWPLGAIRCEAGHLHFEPSRGLVEVLDPDTGRPAAPGEVGTIVATPFPPYRDTTLVLRYDTEDLVQVVPGPLDCRLRHLPATSDLIGKRRLAVRTEDGWTTPRQVLEALETVEGVPLPARCGFWAVPGGVAVEVLVRDPSSKVRRTVDDSLERQGVPVQELRLVEDRGELASPLPLRGDLEELGFPLGGTEGVRAPGMLAQQGLV